MKIIFCMKYFDNTNYVVLYHVSSENMVERKTTYTEEFLTYKNAFTCASLMMHIFSVQKSLNALQLVNLGASLQTA